MLAVYALEIRRLRRGPSVWVIAALLQVVLGWYCLSALEQYLGLQAKFSLQEGGPGLTTWLLARFSYPSAFALLLAVPALSMQSLATERREGSLTLLLASPVSATAIAWGKFAALSTVLSAYVALALLNLLAVALLAPLDLAAIGIAHLSLLGLTLSAAAIGLLCSANTSSPVAAAFSCSAVLLVMWLMGGSQSELFAGLSTQNLSLPSHLGRGLQGVAHSGDFSYFVIITAAALMFVSRRLANMRLHGAL
ncbi:MAG: ABC transporter permease [Granulosicoccaceae bacterium]